MGHGLPRPTFLLDQQSGLDPLTVLAGDGRHGASIGQIVSWCSIDFHMYRRAGSSFTADQCSFHRVVFHRKYFRPGSAAVLVFIVDSIRIIGLVAIVRTT